MKLRSIIIDDEEPGRENLAQLLGEYCPEIEVIAQAASADEAMALIVEHSPNVLFLDIQMPNKNGFDLLDSIEGHSFSVIFVTAHDQYGIRAIKASAIDYLLKPVGIEELKESIDKVCKIEAEKAKNIQFKSSYDDSIQDLLDHWSHDDAPKKISINTGNKIQVIELEKLSRLEGFDNYSKLILNNQNVITDSKCLKNYEEFLDQTAFVRVHKSHIVNLAFIDKVVKEGIGFVILMNDESQVPVARRRSKSFFEKFNSFVDNFKSL